MTPSQRLISLATNSRQTLLTGIAQGTVHLLGFVSGLLIVRLLPPEQYAWYTMALAAFGAMQNIADGGVINGVLAQGGQVWREPAKLGAVLASGLRLRVRMTSAVAILALPLLWFALQHQGAGPWHAALVGLALLPLFVVTMSTSFWETVPKLHQELRALQVNQLIGNFSRAVIIVLFVTAWPLAAVALLAPTLAQWWINGRVRRMAAAHAEPRASIDPEVTRRLVAHVKRILPMATYYALSSQLTIWLISIFGRTSSVAALGAMSRIAIVLTVLLTTFALLAVPRFARIPEADRGLLWSRFWQAQALLAAACAIPTLVVLLAPGLVLALLGPNYGGLERELQLVMFGGLMATLAGGAFALSAARGIVVQPWLVIPAGILVQALLIFLLPIDTIAGVVWLGILNASFEWLVFTGYFRIRGRSVAT